MPKNRIALVDSTIDYNVHKKNLIDEYSFLPKGNRNVVNNHGTLCCSAILSINPLAEIYSIPVLNDDNQCLTETILEALNYLLDIDVDIINLSLSTSSVEYEKEYERYIKRLREQGKIVISSLANNHSISIPARLPEVIGVQGNLFVNEHEYWFNRTYQIQCVADSKPVLLRANHGEYQLFGGNSKATAIFSGIVSSMYIYNCESELFLEKKANKNIWTEVIPEEFEFNPIEINEILYQRLKELVINVFEILDRDVDKIEQNRLYNCGLTKYNTIMLLKEIEREFRVEIDYKDVTIYWFYSLENLYYKIFGRGKKHE